MELCRQLSAAIPLWLLLLARPQECRVCARLAAAPSIVAMTATTAEQEARERDGRGRCRQARVE